MSTLIVDELFDGIEIVQDIRLKKSINLGFLRLWIYKEGTLQDGDFTVEIYDGATLLATTVIDYQTINNEFTQNYAHGFLRIDFDPLALSVKDTELNHIYTIKIRMDNHITNTTNYIALCKEWENQKYQIYNGPALNDMVKPFAHDVYSYQRR